MPLFNGFWSYHSQQNETHHVKGYGKLCQKMVSFLVYHFVWGHLGILQDVLRLCLRFFKGTRLDTPSALRMNQMNQFSQEISFGHAVISEWSAYFSSLIKSVCFSCLGGWQWCGHNYYYHHCLYIATPSKTCRGESIIIIIMINTKVVAFWRNT